MKSKNPHIIRRTVIVCGAIALLFAILSFFVGCAGYDVKVGGSYERDGQRYEGFTQISKLDRSFVSQK